MNATPTSAIADEAGTYLVRSGGKLPAAAGSLPPFDVLTSTAVGPQVAAHADRSRAYRAAQLALQAHQDDRRTALQQDAAALGLAVSSGEADPGPVHVRAYEEETARLERHRDGTRTALLIAYFQLLEAIRAQAADITAATAADATRAREDLAEASAAVVAATTELDQAAGIDRAVAAVLEGGRQMKARDHTPRPWPLDDGSGRPVHVAALLARIAGYRTETTA